MRAEENALLVQVSARELQQQAAKTALEQEARTTKRAKRINRQEVVVILVGALLLLNLAASGAQPGKEDIRRTRVAARGQVPQSPPSERSSHARGR